MSTETLKLKITTDGTGKVKAELMGVAGGLDGVEKNSKKTHKELFNLKNMLTSLSVGALVYFSQRALSAADDLGAFADRIGLSTDALQEMDYVGMQFNMTQANMDMGLQRLLRKFGDAQRGVGEATKMFSDLNVSLTDSTGNFKDNETLINDVADAIANMDDKGAQLSATVKLVDSEAAGMVEVFRAGSDEINRMRLEAHAMGAVMSEDVIEKASDANLKIETLSKVLKTQFTVALTELTPLLVEFGNKMASAAKEAGVLFAMFSDDSENLEVLSRQYDNAQNSIERFTKMRDKMASGKTDGLGDMLSQMSQSLSFGGVQGLDKLIAQYQSEADQYGESIARINGEIMVAAWEAEDKAQQKEGGTNLGPVIDPNLLKTTMKELESYQAQIGKTGTELLTLQVRTKLGVDANYKLDESLVSLIDNISKEKEALQTLNQLKQEGKQITEQVLTPTERYIDQQTTLNALLERKIITQETYNRAIHESGEAFEAAQFGQYFADLSEGVEQLKAASNSWASQFTDVLVDMAMTGKASFKDLADSIIRDMMRIAMQQAVIQPLMASMGFGAPASPAPTMGAGHAAGGAVSGGLYPVNEVRPEMLSSGGQDYLMMPQGTQGFVKASKPNGTATTQGKGASFNVKVINQGNGQASVENVQQNESGGFDMDVLVGQVDSAMARMHQSGNSQFGNTLSQIGSNRTGSSF